MSRHAGAVARRATPHQRAGAAPRVPRRVSGPSAPSRRIPGGLDVRPPLVDLGLGRVRSLPEAGLVDKLLRSRAWIWLIGLLLGGIVTMQVSLLKLNHGIGRAVESAATLERQNAALEADIARLSSGERIRATAMRAGMVMPEAGDIGYLSVRSGDARRAALRMQPPSDEARSVMERGGRAEPTVTAPAATTVDGATAPAVTPDATAPVPPAPTPTPAPLPTEQPPATATGGAAPAEG